MTETTAVVSVRDEAIRKGLQAVPQILLRGRDGGDFHDALGEAARLFNVLGVAGMDFDADFQAAHKALAEAVLEVDSAWMGEAGPVEAMQAVVRYNRIG